MSYDNNNVFARILRGELPCHEVYRDEHTLAFMDVMPQSDGHVLVIPREPATDLLELSAEGAAACIRTTQVVARAVKAATQAPGVMIAQLNGTEAGQTVFHIHFHIIPRYSDEPLRPHGRDMEKPEKLAALAERIRAQLADR